MTDLTGTYWQHTGTKKIVRICGEITNHPDGMHWGREPGKWETVVFRPNHEQWVQLNDGMRCRQCGIEPGVPLELHTCDPAQKVIHAARHVVSESRGHWDEVPWDTFGKLETALREYDAANPAKEGGQ